MRILKGFMMNVAQGFCVSGGVYVRFKRVQQMWENIFPPGNGVSFGSG